MPVYNISAMADRIQYLQNTRQMSEAEATTQMQREMGLGEEPLPTEVQEQITNSLQASTQDSPYARNDKDSIVDRTASTSGEQQYDLGGERTDLTTPSSPSPSESEPTQ